MRKFLRTAEPDFLAANAETWGLNWERRKIANPAAKFHWHELEGEPINHKLLPLLKNQTQDHCSFCDAFPVSPPSIDTIEHFRPKNAFPRDAYRWTNLYFCCTFCQQKNDAFVEELLQPDSHDFDFDTYFQWDFTRGTLEINRNASEANQKRAEATIKLYRLNVEHPKLRKMWSHLRMKLADESLDMFPYRSFIEGPVPRES